MGPAANAERLPHWRSRRNDSLGTCVLEGKQKIDPTRHRHPAMNSVVLPLAIPGVSSALGPKVARASMRGQSDLIDVGCGIYPPCDDREKKERHRCNNAANGKAKREAAFRCLQPDSRS